MRPLTLIFVVSAALAGPAAAQPLEPLWPGAVYDEAVPTLRAVVGHEPGTEITPPDQVRVYLDALVQAAPDRARLVDYARTWEGRQLSLIVIGSPDRIRALDEVKKGLQRLADPRGLSDAEAARLVEQLPVVVWLVHGVHGNEISSSDAALHEAYHLLASRGDADVDLVLRDALVLIDPMQNPDGRARFVFQNLQARAASPDPTPYNAEHDEPWPGGRSNHYLFDMNRDWFAQTQPETRGRITIAREYWPHVTVDLHEQGGDATYYFAPPADPLNPHVAKGQIESFELFGRANAARFDERGWLYFIREVYDSFYPGYGESWPIFHGSVGMTYEQASPRSLSFARRDGTTLTYRDAVMHHFNAAMTTAITAAKNRRKLVGDFLEYRRGAIAEGERGPVREYVLVPGHDRSRVDLLARNLATQGIEVRHADEPFKVEDRSVPAGAYLVSNAQPAGRLIRNLLDPRTEQPAEFVKRQEERRARRQPDEIYDITAWSLPLLFDVEVLRSAAPVRATATLLSMAYDAPNPPRVLERAKVAYLVPWGSGAAALATEALAQGMRMRSVGGRFTLGGRDYPIGTLVIRVADNPDDLHARLTALATAHGVELVPIDSTYVESGTSFGSNQSAFLKAPRVLLLWDAPTQALSAGWARYVLERRFKQPVTIVRTSALSRAELHEFDVVVLPSGNYGGQIASAEVSRLKDWLRAGGTLVTLAEATRWATGPNVTLLETTPLLRDGRPDVPPAGSGSGGAQPPASQGSGQPADAPGSPPKPAGTSGSGNAPSSPAQFDYDKAIQPDRERPDPQPGAILNVSLDTEHWLSAGHDPQGHALIEGSRVFAPIKLDKGRNVAIYGKKEALIASGLVWPENQDLLVQKPYLMHQPVGQGHVIAFAEDPNFRAFAEGTMLLFMNAVLLGPGY